MNSKCPCLFAAAILAILPGVVGAQDAAPDSAPPAGNSALPPQARVSSPRWGYAGLTAPQRSTGAGRRRAVPKRRLVRRSALRARPVIALPSVTAAPTMSVPARIAERFLQTHKRINVRQGPGRNHATLASLDKPLSVTVTAVRGDWKQVRLPDGRQGWMLGALLEPQAPLTTAAAAPKVTLSPPRNAATPLKKQPASPPGKADAAAASARPDLPTTTAARPSTPTPSAPTSGSVRPSALTKDAKTDAPEAAETTSALAGTKPDPTDRTQDSPAAAMADAWKLLLYLLPILGLTILTIHGLKRFYQCTGGLPTSRMGLLGGFNLANARRAGGSSIRVVESVPIGTVGLHLVEVRGRLLLLGTSGSEVRLLTEVTEENDAQVTDFRALLHSAAADMEDSLDETDAPLSAVVGSLDDSLREVREAIARNSARLRHGNEEEDVSSRLLRE